jgi:alkylation response protein AidB-like acyl-CoA dehydrogenase
MDFAFSEEQEMLRESVRRFLADNCPTSYVRKMMADPSSHDPAFWKQISDLGWLALLIPEPYGGQGGSFLDMTVIAEEAGKALVPGPFFATALLAAPIIVEGGAEELKRDLLPKMAKGEFIGTAAIAESSGRFDASGIELKAVKRGKKYSLRGEKFFVPDAHVSDAIMVAARTARGAEAGISLFIVDSKLPGIAITQLKTLDMTRRLCRVTFDNVTVEATQMIGAAGQGWPILRRALDMATAGLSVEMVGTAQKALDLSVEYAKTRVQFGRPIGSFQAVKHKCVDMMVAVENARSLAYYACWAVDERSPEAASAVPMAKAYASDMAKSVTSDAIQVHGGIGFTWEHDMHLYHRRALASEANFGNAPIHRETVAQSLLD